MVLSTAMVARIRQEIEEDVHLTWEEFAVSNLSESFSLSLRTNAAICLTIREQSPVTKPVMLSPFDTTVRSTVATTFRLTMRRAPHPSGATSGSDSIESESALLSAIRDWLYLIPDHLRALDQARTHAERDRQIGELVDPLNVPDAPFTPDELASLHSKIEAMRERLEALINEAATDKAEAKRAISELQAKLRKLEASAPRMTKYAFMRLVFAILLGIAPVLESFRQIDRFVREIGLLPPI